ncbi:MAG: 50S ribosomal protein L21 [Phycisphaerae bacterium]
MYAIVDQGGRQHKVTTGQKLTIDTVVEEGQTELTLERVLLVGGEEGQTKVGTPLVAGATVTAEVLGRVKGKKLTIQKYKRRKGYHLKKGHRQQYTEIKVTAINA